MAHVISLARRGEALASPNPMVGAVLVRGGRVVGEGFHIYEGRRHAEVIALEAAGRAARGSTLYINLEPCCHQGRTPPCTSALISAGIARVVAALRDPNPAVAGRGFRQLRAAGIDVRLAREFEDEARRLNEAFAKWVTRAVPFVTLKSALTLDGQMVLPGAAAASKNAAIHPRSRRPTWITSPASRQEVQSMRHASDALLTGIGTILADDPLLTDRTGLPRRRPLLRVVLDSHLRLSPRSRLVRTASGDVLVFTRDDASDARARALRRAGVEVVALPATAGARGKLAGVDLRAVLRELARRDVLSVLLEAGPALSQAALDLNVVDKVRLFYAPKLASLYSQAGEGPHLRSEDRSTAHFLTVRELTSMRIERFGPDFAIEGYVRHSAR